jgi:cobalamin biosynthesis protein CbiD
VPSCEQASTGSTTGTTTATAAAAVAPIPHVTSFVQQLDIIEPDEDADYADLPIANYTAAYPTVAAIR